MDNSVRRQRILELLNTQDCIEVREIIARIDASPATIRRDLVGMERNGLIRKARGKVFRQTPLKAPPFDFREQLQDREKHAMGCAAARLVDEGDSIIIDSGTTTLAFAEKLVNFNRLSVVTNSIPVAYVFNGTKVHAYMCGGLVNDMALIDNDAISYLSSKRVDKAFIGATGVRGVEGLTVSLSMQCQVKRSMIEAARSVYALVDSSKFDFSGVSLFARFEEFAGVVTGGPIRNQELLEKLDRLKVRVIYADGM